MATSEIGEVWPRAHHKFTVGRFTSVGWQVTLCDPI